MIPTNLIIGLAGSKRIIPEAQIICLFGMSWFKSDCDGYNLTETKGWDDPDGRVHRCESSSPLAWAQGD